MINIGLAVYAAGVLGAVFFLVPDAQGLGPLVKIAFFHIPSAWVSVLAFLLSAYWALLYLRGKRPRHDLMSARAAKLGLLFCLAATVSGAVFAKLTWGAYWNWDPRETTIFVLLLMYGAYFTLRGSIAENALRAKLSAVYSLLSCAVMPFLVFVLPRVYFSLHPDPIVNRAGSVHMDGVMLYTLLAALAFFTAIFWRLMFWQLKEKGEGNA